MEQGSQAGLPQAKQLLGGLSLAYTRLGNLTLNFRFSASVGDLEVAGTHGLGVQDGDQAPQEAEGACPALPTTHEGSSLIYWPARGPMSSWPLLQKKCQRQELGMLMLRPEQQHGSGGRSEAGRGHGAGSRARAELQGAEGRVWRLETQGQEPAAKGQGGQRQEDGTQAWDSPAGQTSLGR